MNEIALKKVKKELLLNSKVGKERIRLSEEYRDGVIRITNEILGKEGIEFLEKYKEYVSNYDELLIPGQTTNHIFSKKNSGQYCYYYYDCFGTDEITLPKIIPSINNVYNYNKNDFDTEIIPKEEDRVWIINIRQELEKNAEEYESLWKEIENVFKNITEEDLKTFPEAYSMYIKFRNEQKNE